MPSVPAPPVVAPAPEAAPAPAVQALGPPVAGEEIRIEAGLMHAGSRPGTEGRNAEREADLVELSLPAFSIDRLPFPNDPALPPRTSATRAEAEALCEADGKRLCHELEWERACEGLEGATYPGAAPFDVERCALDPTACASPDGTLSMGATLSEWTASDASFGLTPGTAVIRGAGPLAEAALHRCASRRSVAPELTSEELTFRCCRGAPPAIAYPTEPARAAYRELDVDVERLRAILATMPELRAYAADFRPFTAAERDRPAGRSGRSLADFPGYAVPRGVLAWAPTPTDETWIVTGVGAGSTLLAVIYPLPDGSFVHGGSFILQNEPVPVNVMFGDQPAQRRELLWSACWGCGGEGGAITLRDDGRIVVSQR